jgi:hypothetical protein
VVGCRTGPSSGGWHRPTANRKTGGGNESIPRDIGGVAIGAGAERRLLGPAMSETLKTTKASLTALYAVLTDAQKKTADQLIHGPMGIGPM